MSGFLKGTGVCNRYVARRATVVSPPSGFQATHHIDYPARSSWAPEHSVLRWLRVIMPTGVRSQTGDPKMDPKWTRNGLQMGSDGFHQKTSMCCSHAKGGLLLEPIQKGHPTSRASGLCDWIVAARYVQPPRPGGWAGPLGCGLPWPATPGSN